ncbi:hypothetical protein SKB0092_12160 [Roseomonas mucosa]
MAASVISFRLSQQRRGRGGPAFPEAAAGLRSPWETLEEPGIRPELPPGLSRLDGGGKGGDREAELTFRIASSRMKDENRNTSQLWNLNDLCHRVPGPAGMHRHGG